MEKQPERKPLPAHILRQVEQCGWAAQLSQQYREIMEDRHGARDVRTEIRRAYEVRDMATLEDAHSALRWLSGEPGQVEQVGAEFNLEDNDGVVLTSGHVGVVVVHPDGEVLVAQWVVGDRYNYPDPEEDLGLVAAGLAFAKGRPFKVAHVFLAEGDAFPRRSKLFAFEDQAELWGRIIKASSAPRVPCPGDWCGHCRQAQYCEAWLARAQAALGSLSKVLKTNDEGKIEKADGFTLDDENAGDFYECLVFAKKAHEFGYDLVKSHARKGGKVMHNGKMLVLTDRDGRVTVTTSEFKDILKRLRAAVKAAEPVDLDTLADALEATIKTGDPYEYPLWKAPSAIGGGRR